MSVTFDILLMDSFETFRSTRVFFLSSNTPLVTSFTCNIIAHLHEKLGVLLGSLVIISSQLFSLRILLPFILAIKSVWNEISFVHLSVGKDLPLSPVSSYTNCDLVHSTHLSFRVPFSFSEVTPSDLCVNRLFLPQQQIKARFMFFSATKTRLRWRNSSIMLCPILLLLALTTEAQQRNLPPEFLPGGDMAGFALR